MDLTTFSFKAVRADGQTEEGELEAADEASLVAALQRDGLIPIRVRPVGGLGGLFSRRARPRVGAKEVGMLTRELATLLEAGLPLDRALQVLMGLAGEDPSSHALLSDVQHRVRGGATFSEALEAQGEIFSRLYINMVRAGEASGSLDAALHRLSEYLERSAELRETIKSALVYPTILVFVAGLSLVVLLAWVVPQFTQLFQDMGAALPLPTRIVVAIGDLFRGYWWALVGLVALAVAGAQNLLRRPHLRLAWDTRLLHWPVIGDLLWKLETARFCHTLSTLLENGMPLLGALGLAKEVVSNRCVAGRLEAIADDLKRGRGLAGPLTEARVFPNLALQMIRVGEEVGHLDPMLTKVARVYDRETQAAVQRLLTLLEPALIIGLGITVAGIIISILMAILGANELVA
jgi:general secretion pathway protein F